MSGNPGPDYLGDGVYAEFDGYNIVLDLRGQDNYTRIALEPSVLDALDRYRNRCWPPLEQSDEEIDEAKAVAEDWDNEMLGDDALILADHDIGNK